MITILKELIRNLVLLLLLATFLELLLPKSTLSRHIRLVVGVFVMLTILQPILQLFNWQGPVKLSIREPPYEETREIVQQGIELRAHQQSTALQAAKQRLEQQVEAMIYLNLGIGSVHADLTLENLPDSGPMISQAKIYVLSNSDKNSGQTSQIKEVETVIINTEQSPDSSQTRDDKKSMEQEQLKEKIVNGVSAYLDLDKDKVHVVIEEPMDS